MNGTERAVSLKLASAIQPRIIQLLYFGSGFILIWHQDETLARTHQPAPAARWLPRGDVAEQGKRSGPPALRSVEGKNAYSRYRYRPAKLADCCGYDCR